MINTNFLRQITLDTETTGFNKLGIHYEGHRIIEIGAVEIINRHITGRYFHFYLKPNRIIDSEAFNIHGISNEFLMDKPIFADIADEFINFISNSELIIHNAPFDIGFINYEFEMLNRNFVKIDTICQITDSLQLARKMFPGKRNSLDALCSRYLIDNSKRTLHGALLDAEILAEIFMLMTSGQISMNFMTDDNQEQYKIKNNTQIELKQYEKILLKVILADNKEKFDHEQQLNLIKEKSGICLWQNLNKLKSKQD